ncbi:uncharacterized protein CXQ87_003421 [Candidozyma duobushaemuli]|uniref:Uncharacterized protein n=1 Tax=Candidozyma duobushaemuli TaxID=1231522 RepID=A0A2V1ADF9_9ASCO|nr:uncharacterized protein CXQ87_003421 [[Candida] duobushaemulonis]PVH15576.1 hypothetical protein CXQ87_003421 [[Candida] duobushaemulonis]
MEPILIFLICWFSFGFVATCIGAWCWENREKKERHVPVQSANTGNNPQAVQETAAQPNQEITVPEGTAASVHESIRLEDLPSTTTGEGSNSNASVETPLPVYQSDLLPQYSEVEFDR